MSKITVSATLLATIIVGTLFLVQITEARPSQILRRPKRVSDQRLAELETLIALRKMKGMLMTVPVGFGKVDPYKLGRKRRSSNEINLLELRRILRAVLVDNVELSPKDRRRFAQFLSSQWDVADQEDQPSDEDELQFY